MPSDSIDYELRQARGTGLRALVEMWLSSGSLFNQEERFLEVLQAAGVKGATLDDPNATRSAVYPVYLSIKNPLDTANIPGDVVSALEHAGKRKRAKQSAGGNPDAWDKNTISGNDWMASLKEDMATGLIDLAMGLLPQLQAGFFQQALFRQKYICLMRKGHALAGQNKLDLASFTAAEHVRIVAAGTGHGRVDVALEQQKLRRRFRLTVPHYVALGDVLSHSDLIATVPERFADRTLGPFGLVKCDLPMAVDESAIHQFWHGRLHRDPGHRWLRQAIQNLFGDGETPQNEQAV
jgi:hypothetical protein